MNQFYKNKELVVLAYDWPGNQGGYRMSCKSCLLAYLQVFQKVHFICISDKPFPDTDQWRNSNINWVYVPTVTRPLWLRFVSSLISPLPAITMRYMRMSRQVMSEMFDIVADCQSKKGKLYVVIQAIPMGVFLKKIRKSFPNVSIAVSSHDLCVQAFKRFAHEGSLLTKLAWKIELAKIKTFERNVCLSADKFWTITNAEAKEYEKQLCVKADGVFYRGVDTERYASTLSGNPKVVVHVGSADLRKGLGLSNFVERVWPQVKNRIPEAKLVLAGRFTDRFTNTQLGIEGLGFIQDDIEVLNRGMIFLNCQTHGAGLQFKSIIAMLAGKTLLTTSMGIEGIEGNDGEHFFVADTPDSMTERIVALMNDTELCERVAQAGRILTLRIRNHKYAAKKAVPLLEEFAKLN